LSVLNFFQKLYVLFRKTKGLRDIPFGVICHTQASTCHDQSVPNFRVYYLFQRWDDGPEFKQLVVKVISQKMSALPPHTDGLIVFARWRQGAPPCNKCFLGPIRIHIPQPRRHLDRFSHFCTAHRRVSLYFTMGRPFPPLKIAPFHGDLDPI